MLAPAIQEGERVILDRTEPMEESQVRGHPTNQMGGARQGAEALGAQLTATLENINTEILCKFRKHPHPGRSIFKLLFMNNFESMSLFWANISDDAQISVLTTGISCTDTDSPSFYNEILQCEVT